MRPIAILILGMGLIGSPVVQAQGAGQGSAVPRQNVLVAQAEKPASTPPAGAPAAGPSATAIAVGVGVAAAAIVAASGGSSSTSHH
jgi:hypothetical protein